MDNKDTAPAKIGESVKISTDAIAICKKVKYLTGVPMGRFIVEAVYEKAKRLPKKVREQIFKD